MTAHLHLPHLLPGVRCSLSKRQLLRMHRRGVSGVAISLYNWSATLRHHSIIGRWINFSDLNPAGPSSCGHPPSRRTDILTYLRSPLTFCLIAFVSHRVTAFTSCPFVGIGFLRHPLLLAELDSERSGRALECDGGDHDLQNHTGRRHPSDSSADRDVWWSKYTFPF